MIKAETVHVCSIGVCVCVAVYSSINETVDTSQLVEDGYYAAPKSMDKVVNEK